MSKLRHLASAPARRLALLLLATIAAILVTTSAGAQAPIDDPIVTVTTHRPSAATDEPLTIGDPIIVTLTITHDARAAIALPTTPQPLGGLEPATPQVVSRVDDGDRVTWRFDFDTRAFFTGEVLVQAPPFLFIVDQEQRTITPPPTSISVSSILPFTDAPPRPLKPPLSIDGAGLSRLLIVGPALGLAGLLLLAWIGRRLRMAQQRRRAIAPTLGPTPARVATASLDAIGAAALLPSHLEEYCARINDTVRAFLQTRYTIPATSLTSRELPHRLALAGADAGTVNMVNSLCDECDAVAYARARPAQARAARYLDLAHTIVNPTQPLSTDAIHGSQPSQPTATDDNAPSAIEAGPDPAPPPATAAGQATASGDDIRADFTGDSGAPLTNARWQRPPPHRDPDDDANNSGGSP